MLFLLILIVIFVHIILYIVNKILNSHNKPPSLPQSTLITLSPFNSNTKKKKSSTTHHLTYKKVSSVYSTLNLRSFSHDTVCTPRLHPNNPRRKRMRWRRDVQNPPVPQLVPQVVVDFFPPSYLTIRRREYICHHHLLSL